MIIPGRDQLVMTKSPQLVIGMLSGSSKTCRRSDVGDASKGSGLLANRVSRGEVTGDIYQ